MSFSLGASISDSNTATNHPVANASGIDAQAAAEFMRAVVPEPGVGHYLSIHTLFQFEHGGAKRQAMPGKGFTSANDAADHLAYWLRRQPQEMFFCLSTQGVVKPPAAGKPPPRQPAIDRKIENAVAIRCLFADLDVKPGAYASQSEAMAAMIALVKAGSVPVPSAWVNSGHGIHVYWLLEEPTAFKPWQPLAEGFGNFLMQQGIHMDRFAADMARVLRAPGTLNCKDPANPLPVKLIGKIGARLPLTGFEKYRGTPAPAVERKLTPGAGVVPLHPTTSASRAGRETAQDRLGASAVSALLGASGGATVTALAPYLPAVPHNGLGNELTQGVNEAQATPIVMAKVVEQCEVLKDVVARGGSGDAEPFWRHNLYAATFATDGREWAHKFSSGDARYSVSETDTKYDTILAQRQSQGGRLGWPSCSTFNQFSSKCQQCPFQGRVYSPMHTPDAQDNSDVPPGYERIAGTFWKTITKKGAKGEPDEEVQVNVFAYGLRDAFLEHVPGEGMVINTEVIVPNSPAQRLKVPVTQVNTWRDRIHSLFGQYGVSIAKKLSSETQEFFVAFLKLLQERAGAVQHRESFGWTTSRDGKKGFAFAGSVYKADGMREVVANTEGTLEALYRPKGDILPWKRAAEAVTLSGRPDLALIVASAFAAPLVRFTGVSGLLLSAYSPQSGVQKSTAMEVAQAVWGDPKRAMNGLDDTPNSVLHKLGTVRNLPLLWDEMHNKDSAEPFVKMIFALTQGKEKSRLNSDITQRQTGRWETMLVAASNFSIQEMMTVFARNTSAGLNRVMEMTIQPAAYWKAPMLLQSEAAGLSLGLVNNYGRAGEIYAAALSRREATLEAGVMQIVDMIQRVLNTTAEERFWVYTAATLLLGARLASAEGIVQFDTKAMWVYLQNLITQQRENKRSASVDVTAPEFVADIVVRYLNAARGRGAYLITDGFSAGAGRTAVSVKQSEDQRRNLRSPVVQFAQDDGRIRIVRNDFQAWLAEQKIPQRQIIDGLVQHGGMQQGRYTLGAGTEYSIGRITCLEVDVQNTTRLGALLDMPRITQPKV